MEECVCGGHTQTCAWPAGENMSPAVAEGVRCKGGRREGAWRTLQAGAFKDESSQLKDGH